MKFSNPFVLGTAFFLTLASCGKDEKNFRDEESCQAFDNNSAAMSAYVEVANNVYDPATANFALGCEDLPTPDGSLCTYQLQVKDFQEDEFLPVLAGTTVKVFPSNTIDDLSVPCVAPDSTEPNPVCYEGTADATGRIDFPMIQCNTRVAVWAYKSSTTAPVTKRAAEFNRAVVPGQGIEDALTISNSTYNLIPGIVGFAPDPTMGIVGGKLHDCSDHGLQNVNVNIESGSIAAPTNARFCGSAPMYRVGTFYFDAASSLPTKELKTSSENGVFAFVNVPPGVATVFAAAKRDSTSGISHNIGRVHLVSLPDTIVIADVLVEP